MDLDGPRESESMSMDIDDGAVPCHHPHHCDSVKMDSPGPSGGRMSSDFHPQKDEVVGSVQTSIHSLPSHLPPGYERLTGSDGSPQLMIPPSPSSPVIHLGEMGDINRSHRAILLGLEPSVREVAPRKRKRTHDSPTTHIMDYDHTHQGDDAFTDDVNSPSPRRIRPRLWIPQDREFPPLLIMSPGEERDPPVEEMIGVSHHPQDVTNPSHSIQRCFYLGNPPEHDPCTLQSSSSPKDNDPRDHKERGRSDSTNSFAEVALASTMTQKDGRLSTLQDFWLPRPFEETGQSSVGIVKVHERGLDAGPSFPFTNSGRAGGLRASREPASSLTDTLGHDIRAPICEHGTHACSSRSAMLPLEPSSTNFFDKPICDSPDPIDPTDEDGLTHFELPAVQVTRAGFKPSFRGSICSSHGGQR